MRGWHSASWSRGKEPFAGGLGRPILTPVPGAPKVDILEMWVVGRGCSLYWVDVFVFMLGSLMLVGSSGACERVKME